MRCNTTHYLSSLSGRETLKSNIDPLLEILIPAEPQRPLNKHSERARDATEENLSFQTGCSS